MVPCTSSRNLWCTGLCPLTSFCSEESFRLEIAEGKIFELAANHAHAQAMRNRRVDVQSFARDLLLLGGLEIIRGCACCEGDRPA